MARHLLNITRSTAYLISAFMVIVGYMLLITLVAGPVPLEDHGIFFALPLMGMAVLFPRWIMIAEYRLGLTEKPKRSNRPTTLDGLVYMGDNFLRGVLSLGVVCVVWPFKLMSQSLYLPGTVTRSIGKALLRFVNAGFAGADAFTDFLVQTDHQTSMMVRGLIWAFRASMWLFSRLMFAPFYLWGYGMKWAGELYIRLIKGISAGIREAMRDHHHDEADQPIMAKPKRYYDEEPVFYLGDDGEIYQQVR